jgi:YbbR domain-containing protein
MRFRALITEHFWLKLFALLLASLIWIAVDANRRSEVTVVGKQEVKHKAIAFEDLPIHIMTDSATHPPIVVAPTEAKVSVHGPLSLIESLTRDHIYVFVRITAEETLNGQRPLHAHVVMKDATVTLVDPQTVFVKAADIP